MAEGKQNTGSLDSITSEAVQKLSQAPGEVERGLLEDAMEEGLTADNAVSNGKKVIEGFVADVQNTLRRSAKESEGDTSELQPYFDRLAEAQKNAFEELDANAERYKQIEKFVQFRLNAKLYTEDRQDKHGVIHFIKRSTSPGPEALKTYGLSERQDGTPVSLTPSSLADLEALRADMRFLYKDGKALAVPGDLAAERDTLLQDLNVAITNLEKDAAFVRGKIEEEISVNLDFAHDIEGRLAKYLASLFPVPRGVATPDISLVDVFNLQRAQDRLKNFQAETSKLMEGDPLKDQISSAVQKIASVSQQVTDVFVSEVPQLQDALGNYKKYAANLQKAEMNLWRLQDVGASSERIRSARSWLNGARERYRGAVDNLVSLGTPEDAELLRSYLQDEEPENEGTVPVALRKEKRPAEEEEASGDESGEEGAQEENAPEEPAVHIPEEGQAGIPVAQKPEKTPSSGKPDIDQAIVQAAYPDGRPAEGAGEDKEDQPTAPSKPKKKPSSVRAPERVAASSTEQPGIPSGALNPVLQEIAEFNQRGIDELQGLMGLPSIGADELRAVGNLLKKYGAPSKANLAKLRKAGFRFPSEAELQPGEKITFYYKDPRSGIENGAQVTLPGEKPKESDAIRVAKPATSPKGEPTARSADNGDPLKPLDDMDIQTDIETGNGET